MLISRLSPLLVWLTFGLATQVAGCGVRPGFDPEHPHHLTDGTYRNPHAGEESLGLGQLLLWRLGCYDETLPAVPAGFRYPNPQERVDPARPRVTWINHSTFLIELGPWRFLTDPIWSERASPVSWAGPRRHHPVPIGWERIGPIDFVLISHNHYDHLDRDTVRRLGNRVRWFVPLGVADWFREQGITRVDELDWWQSASFAPDLWVTAVPAQHFSMRSLFDLDETLWAGWVVAAKPGRSPGKTVYFAGDTGYNAVDFRALGHRFGGVDLSLLPIGAYSPRRLMHTRHVSPADAVEMHRDVGSRLSVAMHHRTFRQTDESLEQPPYDLLLALAARRIPAEEFRVLEPGQAINF